MFSDYDENEFLFDTNSTLAKSLNDNDEAALKLLERRYLRHNQDKHKDKKKKTKSKSFLAFTKKKMSLNSIKNEFSHAGKSQKQQQETASQLTEKNEKQVRYI